MSVPSMPLVALPTDDRLKPGDFGVYEKNGWLYVPATLHAILSHRAIDDAMTFYRSTMDVPLTFCSPLRWTLHEVVHAREGLKHVLRTYVETYCFRHNLPSPRKF